MNTRIGRVLVRFCLITSLVGCTSQHIYTSPNTTFTGTREDRRAHLFLFVDTPFTPNSPTRQIGYGGVWSEHLFRTAKHLVEADLSRLVVTNNAGTVCPLQYIRTHPTKDIALLQTALPCFPGAPKSPLQQHPLPNELLYIDKLLKKAPVIKNTSTTELFLDTVLTPGMSGSPLFLADRTLVGIVTAQETTGTEFIVLSQELIASWPDIHNLFLP